MNGRHSVVSMIGKIDRPQQNGSLDKNEDAMREGE
jgi:hypothetical protein